MTPYKIPVGKDYYFVVPDKPLVDVLRQKRLPVTPEVIDRMQMIELKKYTVESYYNLARESLDGHLTQFCIERTHELEKEIRDLRNSAYVVARAVKDKKLPAPISDDTDERLNQLKTWFNEIKKLYPEAKYKS